MAWIRIDDRFRTHPKVQKAKLGGWLAFCGICYCREHVTTDGVIPREAVKTLAPGLSAPYRHAKKLVDVGLWHEHPDGFRIHDFHDWNPSKDDVLSLRDKERDKKRRQRSVPEGHDGDPRERPRDRAGAAGSGSGLGSGLEDLDLPGESAREPRPISRQRGRFLGGSPLYHEQHCPRWGAKACEHGFCIPKYLWPQWERRNGGSEAWLNSLRMFTEDAMEKTPPGAGDEVEKFWPAHFAAHFGSTAPKPATGRQTAAQTTIATLRGGTHG